MRLIINCIYLAAAVIISPRVIYRMLRQDRYRKGWKQRLGHISRQNLEKKCIWLHAVSVGEVNAAKTIVGQLQKDLPDFEIVISSTTDTGFARAQALFGEDFSVFYFPLDLSFTMQRAFDCIRPNICLLMELEVWPNLVEIAKSRKVPVVVVNGRISDRSYPRYRLIKAQVRSVFKNLALVLAQTQEYAERFERLGCAAEQIIVTGSLKYDTAQITDKVQGAGKLAELLGLGDEPFWVAGGTGPGEEKIIIDTYLKLKKQLKFERLRLAIVPRKPERFDEVAKLIEKNQLTLSRYSVLKDGSLAGPVGAEAVILGDTMGDLRKFYSLATIIFVGRSLVPMGGSDMAEAAALGKCTIFGPDTFNFKQTVESLLAGNGAIQVADGAELLAAMEKCLSQPALAQEIAQNGQAVIKKNLGATKRSTEAITKLLRAAESE